jgi:hypothetical protein
MATLLAVLRGSLRAGFAEMIRAFKQDDEMLRRRTETMLQALDRRVLLDLGIEGEGEENTKPKADRSELLSLRTVFSWTRFAK